MLLLLLHVSCYPSVARSASFKSVHSLKSLHTCQIYGKTLMILKDTSWCVILHFTSCQIIMKRPNSTICWFTSRYLPGSLTCLGSQTEAHRFLFRFFKNSCSLFSALMVTKEHVTQYDSVAHWCDFNSFRTTMELRGTEEDLSGFGLFMWFVGNVV